MKQRMRNSTTPASTQNLLELKPERNLEWEMSEDQRVALLVPRFRNKFLVRWLVPRLHRPTFRVTLDEYGSFLWQESDGQTTVRELGERLKARFGDTVEPVYDRIHAFIRELERGDVLRLK